MGLACVAICPSGAMRFGNRRHMLDLAYERLARIRRQYPAAILADSEEVRIIYLYVHNPAYLHTFITNGRLHVGKSSDGRLLIGPSFMKWEM